MFLLLAFIQIAVASASFLNPEFWSRERHLNSTSKSVYVPRSVQYPFIFGDKSALCISVPSKDVLPRDIEMTMIPEQGESPKLKLSVFNLLEEREMLKNYWYSSAVDPSDKSMAFIAQAGSDCLVEWFNEGKPLNLMRMLVFRLPSQRDQFYVGKYSLELKIRGRTNRFKFWQRSVTRTMIDEPRNQRDLMPHHSGFQIMSPSIQWKNKGKSLDVVMAYFKEDLTWMQVLPDETRIFAYYKGGIEPAFPARFQNAYTEPLPNEGRESHSFLHHVIENYDNLADYTYFTLASVDATEFKRQNFNHVLMELKKIAAGQDTDRVKCRSISNEEAGFTLGNWIGDTKANGAARGFTKADVGPFGKWYKTFVDPSADERKGPFDHPCYTGMLIAPKEAILSKPVKYYQRLLSTIAGKENPEEGHFFERSWGGIFSKYN